MSNKDIFIVCIRWNTQGDYDYIEGNKCSECKVQEREYSNEEYFSFDSDHHDVAMEMLEKMPQILKKNGAVESNVSMTVTCLNPTSKYVKKYLKEMDFGKE